MEHLILGDGLIFSRSISSEGGRWCACSAPCRENKVLTQQQLKLGGQR